MASSLTPEQRAQVELNRKLALEKRNVKLAKMSLSNTPVKVLHSQKNLSGSTSQQSRQIISQESCGLLNVNTAIESCSTSCSKTIDSCTLDLHCGSSVDQKNSNSSFTPTSTYPLFNLKSKNDDDTSKFLKNNKGDKLINPVLGMCKLISKTRFTIDIPFHQKAIDVFRTVQGKEYDSKRKLWTFPLSEYFNLRKSLSVLKPHVVVGDLPRCVVETFITKARNFQQDISKVDISRINEKLRETVYPFQKEGIQYGISRNGRCLIADDMGLGKSIQALGIADYYRSDWPLLVVCPSSMRYQWEEEIRINLPNSVHTHQVFVMTSGKDIVQEAKVLILSYDLFAKKKDLIIKMEFGVVILDESHIIKSMKTQRGKAALEVAQHSKRLILLSGTPVLSRPAELYTQIRAVDPSAFPYFKDYGLRYCDGTQTHFGWNFSGSSNMEELKLLLEARFLIRRLKSDVLTQLPSKIRQVIILNSKSLNKNNDSMDAFALKLQSSSLKGSERHGTLLSYFAETAKTKCDAVCEFISDFLQDNRKFLCFAHHADMMDSICNTLEKNKTYYIRIDGSVSAEHRKVLCDKFQYEDKWMVAVLSIKAANTGLTLTAAQVVIFAELFWNPGDLAQAEDRVHRIGQEDCVIVKYLIAKGTADDYLWPLIQSKLEILNKAGLSEDSYITADTKCLKRSNNREPSTCAQTRIDQFFENSVSVEEDEELLKLMDEVEGVQEKKMRLGC